MKTSSQQTRSSIGLARLMVTIALTAIGAAPSVFAASQTWTNAPVDNAWTNANNWVGKAVPGALNSSSTTDIATFNSALPGSLIGGAANPIVYDNTRSVRSIMFNSPDCGPYVIGVDDGVSYMYVGHTGVIVVSNDVVNPIIFGETVRVKIPSSTNARFDITNNAASSAATLTFSNIYNESANTRPMNIWLEGSNTGSNTIVRLQDNNGADGCYQLDKNETGRWILSGANDLPQKTSASQVAHVFVSGGILEVQDPASLGLITTPNIVVATNGSAPNAILQIDNVTLNNAGITLRTGGTIQMNGIGTVNGVTVGNTLATTATLATTSSSDVMTIGNGATANQMTGGAADTVLHITGPGTVLLSQSANYVGSWSIDSGTNQVGDPNALGTGANINISAGAMFDLSYYAVFGYTTYSFSTKGMSASGTGTVVGSTAATINAPGITVNLQAQPVTLVFAPTGFTGDTSHPALYVSQGTLSCNGNTITVNNTSGTPLGVGTYLLAHQASGSITSSGAFVALITGSGLASGTIGQILASGGDLNLVVSAYTPKSLVWTGGDPSNPNTWDRLTSVNWLAGATPSTFNLYDSVIFNSVGSAYSTVDLPAVVQPGSVTVDTSGNSYTFQSSTGAGQIAGGTSLIKIGTGTLSLNTANTYSGGTIVSNGVVKIGIDDAVSAAGNAGSGDVTLYSPSVLDLNNFTNHINALNGDGTVDINGGGLSTLLVGGNGDSGTFSGIIKNTSGTMTIFKSGNGTETLTSSNSYAGGTTIDTGTLRVTNLYALGSGAVTNNNGTLDLATSLNVASLNGAGGVIVNNLTPSTVTNTLIVQGTGESGSLISGRIGVLVTGGTLRLDANNTYTGGTIVSSGAGLAFGNVGQVGTGGVIASNGATISMPTVNSPSPAVAANITTVDGAFLSITSASTASSWNGQFTGSATATNIFANGNMSIGGTYSFSNFLGTVIITNGGVRWFTAVNGGDNTTFIFTNGGGGFTRDATTVRLGALFGNGAITGPSVTPPSTYWIGAKGIDSEFSGTIAGSNNIVKVGPGKLVFDGNIVTTNTDGATFTNYTYASALTYINSTTVSNGVLTLVVPNDFSYSPNITLATPSAVLDASQMGYVTNLYDTNFNLYSLLVTNGVLTVVATTANPNGGVMQVLGGFGIIKGNGVVNNGTIDPGSAGAGGTLSISNGLAINSGAIQNFDLSDDLTGLVTPSDMLLVQGDVTLSGGSMVNIGALNGVLAVGKYPLIKYSGHLINESGIVPSGSIPNFTLGGTFVTTSRATMVLSNAPGEVDLVVVSMNIQDLTWAGDGVGNAWDVVTSFNWTNNAGPSQFYQLDNVTFDDTATNLTAFLQGTVVPSRILVNSSINYVFGGPGNIGGDGMLIKSGLGSLTLTNGANSYIGGTILSNGVLKVGMDSGSSQNDLALGRGPVTVNAPAELRFGGNSGAAVNHFVTNSIIVNGGIIKAQDGVQHLTNSTVTINAAGGIFETVFAAKNLVLDSPVIGIGNLTITSGTNIASGQVVFNNPNNTISGSIVIATNGNLTLAGGAGISNSPSIDIQIGGILDVSTLTNTAKTLVLQSGQTLLGNGLVRGSVIAPAGAVVLPGESGIGTLTLTNVLTLGGLTTMEINRASVPNNSDRIIATNVIAGGTLTVVNLGAALQANDTFQLFNKAVSGAFTVASLPALTTGLIWNNSLAVNGQLKVVNSVNTNAFILTNSISGNVLSLTWPVDHTGYRLQAQTNSLSTGLGTNWVDVANSTSTNKVVNTINPASGSVFYRLIYP